MNAKPSFLDELRNEYETVQRSLHSRDDVEESNVIDARMRKSFRWLEKAVSYLNDIRSPIRHRFDLGHGMVFEAPRFGHGTVGQHTRNAQGFTIVDEINVYYEISASKPVTANMSAVDAELLKARLEAANLRYTCRRITEPDGVVRRCAISVPPTIPAAVMFRADYRIGRVTVTLVNADRFDRVSVAFRSNEIKETVLEDVTKFMLGMDSVLLRRGQLAGIQGQPRG
jgi:hypothetical protein